MAITYLILYPTTTGNGAMFACESTVDPLAYQTFAEEVSLAVQYTIGKAYSISVLLTLLTRSVRSQNRLRADMGPNYRLP